MAWSKRMKALWEDIQILREKRLTRAGVMTAGLGVQALRKKQRGHRNDR